MRYRVHFLATALLAFLGLFASPGAAEGDDCPTLFPDLRCDREGRYEGFVMPMASPFLFEEPFITTGVYVWGLWHAYPDDSVFDGGDLSAAAVQVRLAITDRLAFVATKDGYVFHRPELSILEDEEGFVDIAAGLKYALVDRPEDDFILSVVGRVEVPVGAEDVFSGHGNGAFIPSLSSAWGLGNFHAIGDVGATLPFDGDNSSSSIFYHLHLDYAVAPHFVPFLEVSGYHWTSSGDGRLEIDTDLGTVRLSDAQALLETGGFEGGDLVNLGSEDVDGNDLVTLALGFRIPINRRLSLGLAYEFPVTGREDIFEQRASANLAIEF